MPFTSVMPNLYSADVERAVAFYRDLLGGTQTFRTPADGPAVHVELRLGTRPGIAGPTSPTQTATGSPW